MLLGVFLKFDTSPSLRQEDIVTVIFYLGEEMKQKSVQLDELDLPKTYYRMSRWKLGSMVRKWVISSLSMEYIGVIHVAPLKLISC